MIEQLQKNHKEVSYYLYGALTTGTVVSALTGNILLAMINAVMASWVYGADKMIQATEKLNNGR